MSGRDLLQGSESSESAHLSFQPAAPVHSVPVSVGHSWGVRCSCPCKECSLSGLETSAACAGGRKRCTWREGRS